MIADRWIERIEGDPRIDPIAAKIKALVEPVIGDGIRRDVLTGSRTGHPLHPALVIAPLTGWFAGTLLDLVGGPSSASAARRLIGSGTLAALPTAMSGAADWLFTDSAEERVGTVHAALADSATVLYGVSWLLRVRGSRRAAIVVGLAGASAAAATAYLGGHLSFRRGVGVSTTAFQAGPDEWTTLDVDEEPRTDRAVAASVGPMKFAVVAGDDGAVHVMESRCTHRGGPLHEGVVVDGCLECPWHGARFDLGTGGVRRGPASAPQPVYETRIDSDGRIEIRRSEAGGLRSEVT